MTDVVSAATEVVLSELPVEQCLVEPRGDAYEIGGRELLLMSDPEVFRPTLTTTLLTEHALDQDLQDVDALDLGCGSGPIAIALAKSGVRHAWAVDLMPRACELTARNAVLNGLADRITVLQGDLFEPVKGRVFDLIVDDVSGVAAKVARLSGWFPQQVPLGGADGSILTVKMLNVVRDYLAPRGSLFFPILSLSNRTRILSTAQSVFASALECVATKHVPFSPELRSHLSTLREMRERGLIHFEQIRSRCFWTLEIYKATRGAELL